MGFLNATTTIKTTLDEETNLGSLVVTLNAGKQFFVSSIEILGLDDRMLHAGSEGLFFRVGDVYNLRLLALSLKKQASLLNASVGPVEEHLDESRGTVAVTIDLRQCPR